MTWPRLVMDINGIRSNTEKIVEKCQKNGVQISGVTKGVCAHPEVVSAMVEGGCSFLADSRLKNLLEIKVFGYELPLMLMRIPGLSEIPDVVKYVDYVFISMPETLEFLEKECSYQHKHQKVIIMMDLGDLREGMLQNNITSFANKLSSCEMVKGAGLAVNFACFGGVLPDVLKLQDLVHSAERFEAILGYPLEIISGGATSSFQLIEKGLIPDRVNNLRIGEGILLGSDISGQRWIPDLSYQTMYLETEVIEIMTKPSVPFGKIGADAFGNVPVFRERGKRKRAIVAIGKQDLNINGITPFGKGIEVLGASSDHMILDIEDCDKDLSVGSRLRFSVNYSAMLSLTTSAYVEIITK